MYFDLSTNHFNLSKACNLYLLAENKDVHRLTYMRVFDLWFSGVFGNTTDLTGMNCIPLDSPDLGG